MRKIKILTLLKPVVFISLVLILYTKVAMSDHTNPITLPEKNPFSYDLGLRVIADKKNPQHFTICCHGYGHNNEIVDVVDSCNTIKGNLISFNFPDYDITDTDDHHASSFGSIDELLPLLYIIHYYTCTLQLPSLNLYGFSAGGGAVINALAVLNKKLYEKELANIGISQHDTQQMLRALEKGHILLDCPLKSVEEIIALHGKSANFEIMRKRYEKNNMNPIDNLKLLAGLHLNLIVHFQNPDEILSNRDDELFIQRLKQANTGTTHVIIGSEGGHNAYHTSLWKAYKKLF